MKPNMGKLLYAGCWRSGRIRISSTAAEVSGAIKPFSLYKSCTCNEHEQVLVSMLRAGISGRKYDIDTDSIFYAISVRRLSGLWGEVGGDMQKNWTRYLNGKPPGWL